MNSDNVVESMSSFALLVVCAFMYHFICFYFGSAFFWQNANTNVGLLFLVLVYLVPCLCSFRWSEFCSLFRFIISVCVFVVVVVFCAENAFFCIFRNLYMSLMTFYAILVYRKWKSFWCETISVSRKESHQTLMNMDMKWFGTRLCRLI